MLDRDIVYILLRADLETTVEAAVPRAIGLWRMMEPSRRAELHRRDIDVQVVWVRDDYQLAALISEARGFSQPFTFDFWKPPYGYRRQIAGFIGPIRRPSPQLKALLDRNPPAAPPPAGFDTWTEFYQWRIADLLKAGNGYLDRARQAERRFEQLEASSKVAADTSTAELREALTTIRDYEVDKWSSLSDLVFLMKDVAARALLTGEAVQNDEQGLLELNLARDVALRELGGSNG